MEPELGPGKKSSRRYSHTVRSRPQLPRAGEGKDNMHKLTMSAVLALLAVGALSLFSSGAAAQAQGGQGRGGQAAATSKEPFDPHDFTGVWGGASINPLTKEE